MSTMDVYPQKKRKEKSNCMWRDVCVNHKFVQVSNVLDCLFDL